MFHLVFIISIPFSFSQSTHLIDSLEKVLSASPQDTNKVKVLLRIGKEWGNSDPRKGIDYSLRAIQFAKEISWEKGVAVSYLNTGFFYNNIASYDTALLYNDSAIVAAKELQDKSRLALVYINRGSTLVELNRLTDAQKDFQIAVKYADESGNKDRIARSNLALGNVLYHQELWKEALSYYRPSLEMFRGIENESMEAIVLMNLSNCQKHLKNFDEAEQLIRQSETILLKLNDVNNLILNYSNQAQLYEAKGDTISAIGYYEKTYTLAKQIGDKEIMALNGAYLGEHYLDRNRVKEGMVFLNQAYQFAKEEGYLHEQMDAAQILAKAYAGQGNYSRSYELIKEAMMVKDSLALRRQDDALIEMQAKFETEKKDKEIELLNKDGQLKETEARQQRILKNFFIGGAILLLLLGILLLNRYRLKQRTAKELSEKNKTIEKEKLRAEQSEQFKSQFLANMSHEIRTPMNAVMGFTNLLFDEDDEKKRMNYLTAIKKSSENLLVVINDVLDLSKLEAGKMRLEKIPFRIREVLHFVYESVQLKAVEKGLELRLSIADDVPSVITGDPARLTQVLMNLVGNAVKFTTKGGITLRSEVGGLKSEISNNQLPTSGLTFFIEDTGIGIPRDKLNDIFESFRQVVDSHSRRYGATGLGLTISKNLIGLMGGTLNVESEPGSGSKFSFSIPFEAATEEQLFSHQKKELVFEEDLGEQLIGISILLAEDNEYNQLLVVDTLKKFIPKLRIEVVNNGREVVDILKSEVGNRKSEIGRLKSDESDFRPPTADFDLILMDVQMPEMDGYEATRYIRNSLPSPLKDIPIIALTASVIRTDIDKCLEAGMNSYVAKPFREKELLMEITRSSGRSLKPFSEGVYSDNVNYLKSSDEKFIHLFLQLMPERIESLKSALQNKDWNLLKRTAHLLKPQLLSFGMEEAEFLVNAIELAGDTDPQLQSLGITLFDKATLLYEEVKNKAKTLQ